MNMTGGRVVCVGVRYHLYSDVNMPIMMLLRVVLLLNSGLADARKTRMKSVVTKSVKGMTAVQNVPSRAVCMPGLSRKIALMPVLDISAMPRNGNQSALPS